MKKVVCLICVLALMLAFAGCQEPADAETLAFPGTHWGDTPRQVLRQLDVGEEQIVLNEVNLQGELALDDHWTVVVQDAPCFGQTARSVFFRFIRYDPEGDYCLYRVDVYYPDGTDMAAVLSRMEAQYGPGSEEDPSPSSQTGRTWYTDADGNGVVYTAPGSENTPRFWTVSAEDAVSPEAQQGYVDYVTSDAVEAPCTEEAAREDLQQWMVEASWSDSSAGVWMTNADSALYYTRNHLRFNAAWLVYVEQLAALQEKR